MFVNFLGEKSEDWTISRKNDETEGAGRKTRGEIGKWNQRTALRFQTGGKEETETIIPSVPPKAKQSEISTKYTRKKMTGSMRK